MLRIVAVVALLSPPQSPAASPPPIRAFHAVPFSSPAWPAVVDTLREEAASGARLVEIGDLEAGLAAFDRRFAIVAAAERAGAQEVWWVRFEELTGVLQLEAVDLARGLRTARADKLRAVTGAELGPDPLARLRALGAAVRDGARAQRESLAAGRATDAVAFAEDEEPHLGFTWEYRGSDTVVTYVLDESAAGAAGLAVGDRIVSVAGVDTPSPQHFGRAVAPLQVGDEVALGVVRDGESLAFTIRPEPTAALLRRHGDALLGRRLDGLVDGATATALRGTRPLVLGVLRLGQPQGRLPLLQLAAERARRVADRCTFAVVSTDEVPPVLERWGASHGLTHWIQDEGLAAALRVLRPPAVLIFDAEGVLRERPRTPLELALALDRQVAP